MKRKLFAGMTVLCLAVSLGGWALAGRNDDGIRGPKVLKFLDVSEETEYLDLGEPARGDFDPSPGDTFFFNNTLQNRAGTAERGRFVSKCEALFDAEFKCLGTLILANGTIELSTTVDFASSDPIVAAVVGGTKKYRNVGGQATITPTRKEGTSKLVVRLVAIK